MQSAALKRSQTKVTAIANDSMKQNKKKKPRKAGSCLGLARSETVKKVCQPNREAQCVP